MYSETWQFSTAKTAKKNMSMPLYPCPLIYVFGGKTDLKLGEKIHAQKLIAAHSPPKI